MNTVPNIHNFWRWWSVRFGVLATAFSAVIVTYATLPADWLPAIPQWVKSVCAYGALASSGLVVLTRPIAQTKLPTEK